MANTISSVEEFWRGNTETEIITFLEHFDSSAPGAKPLADSNEDLQEIIDSDDEKVRTKIADRVAKDGKNELGVAYLVLARAASDLAEKEKHYKTALSNTENQTFPAKRRSDDLNADRIHAAIALEFAHVLWINDKADAAIELLQSALETMPLEQDFLDYTFTALETYLICANKHDQARKVLEREPVPVAQWYYFNALLKFKELGDCIQSRSALSIALNDSLMIAVNITDEVDEIDAEDLLTDWDDHYSQITLPAWKQTPGAMEWLQKVIDTKHLLYGAAEVQDEVRFKKWQREMEVADFHLRREDLKSTKKAFKTALREADMLNDGGDMFLLTAKMLGGVLLEYGETLGDLSTSFDKKLAWLDKQESDDYESLFTSYSNFAKTAFELGMLKQAMTCVEKANVLYEKSVEKGTEKLDLFYSSECLFIYGLLLSREKKFEEAEGVFAKLIGIQEEFLGSKHLDLVEGMKARRFCLHELRRHDEEKVLHERLIEIDPDFDADDEIQFKCDAAPVEAR